MDQEKPHFEGDVLSDPSVDVSFKHHITAMLYSYDLKYGYLTCVVVGVH